MKSVTVLMVLALLATSSPVWAEGSGHPYTGEGDVETKPKVARKPKPRPKPAAPAPKLPDAPIPYTALNSSTQLSPDMAKALTPAQYGPATPTTQPVHANATTPVASSYVAPILTVPSAPPSPAESVSSAPTVVVIQAPPPAEISLKCETSISRGSKTVSTGTFYIAIVPSPVFPAEQAWFQFRFVDPAHKSLIRDTFCLDIGCQAQVSPSAYRLINMTTKNGDALRITLDRTQGGFYAESIDDKLVGSSAHLGERGWCTPQPIAAKALF
ncbi:hypothetical protein [Asticcacaulis sp. AC402]|uniref:hypothetical protein n=1 Tax=Asticcacaulis sp. AC402 TaxID=1282361 RepID=UPI0003C3F9D0|nr:hypothetical protein [Asticcacaulis sp. AC402]ESQ74303.1 hypothetical protein ABAC402_15160 [Asticcacaulis sp. AC402]